MRAYTGEFIKKDGSIRSMNFVRLLDIAKINTEFLSDRIGGAGESKEYPEGQELVYDLIADNFRIFNHSTIVTEIKEYEIDDSSFYE